MAKTAKTKITKTSKPSKVEKNKQTEVRKNTRDYQVMTSIIDIMELGGIKFEPSQEWRLVVKKHGINEPFKTGLLGKDGFKLLEIVKNIYEKKLDELPPVKVYNKKEKQEHILPFWGEAIFVNNISIDDENKIVEFEFEA